jgi:hypothetical protein
MPTTVRAFLARRPLPGRRAGDWRLPAGRTWPRPVRAAANAGIVSVLGFRVPGPTLPAAAVRTSRTAPDEYFPHANGCAPRRARPVFRRPAMHRVHPSHGRRRDVRRGTGAS